MQVEIWSDIACPWCYVGKRRFEKALEAFPHRDRVEVVWRSFELDPGAPAERDVDAATHLADKYGATLDEARAMQERVAHMAAQEGLEFRFDRQRGGNTFDAHRLLQLAKQHGKQDEMKERLMRAYFTDGELISDHGTLARLAAEAGVEGAEDMLAGDAFAADVRADERGAAQLGINAVPFFVADRDFGASGAQSPEVLLSLLERAWRERAPAAP